MTAGQGELTEQRKWFPGKMMILSALVMALILVARFFRLEILNWSQIGPDVLNIYFMLAFVLLFLCWMFWCLFFSPFRLLGRLELTAAFLAVPIAFFVFFQPQFGGSANFRGFEYRFAPARDAIVFDSATGKAEVLDANSPGAFPGFLGRDRNGIVNGVALDPNWDSNPPVQVWKRQVGAGWSGVAIASGYVVTQEQRGDSEMVTCYRLDTGEPVWEQHQTLRHEDPFGLGRFGPRATPALFNGMVYAQGATGILLALKGDTGEVVWGVDVCGLLKIGQNSKSNSSGNIYSFEKSRMAWGRSASPLIVDDLVVVAGGYGDDHPDDGATLLAFDSGNGELRWKSGSEMIAYGSPSLATVAGTRQILLQAENQAMGFDAATGDVLWKHKRPGQSNQDANCSQVTFVDAERLLLTKGYGTGGELIRVSREGETFSVSTVWNDPRVLRTKLTNPVVRDGYAWAISDGFIECTNIADGSRVWKQRGNYGDGQLLLVGDWLVIQSESGMLQLVQATSDDPKMSGQIPSVGGVCWNTLAISNDLLVVRSDTEMACFRLPTREPASESCTTN